MCNDNVTKLIQPGAFDDQLTEILRQGGAPCWLMLDEGQPNLIVAFPGGRGTTGMIALARAARREVIEVT